jgi:hypothetical protein
MFVLRDVPQDTLVSEYRGVCVRPAVAEVLEERYKAGGRDCYFFKVGKQFRLQRCRTSRRGAWRDVANMDNYGWTEMCISLPTAEPFLVQHHFSMAHVAYCRTLCHPVANQRIDSTNCIEHPDHSVLNIAIMTHHLTSCAADQRLHLWLRAPRAS